MQELSVWHHLSFLIQESMRTGFRESEAIEKRIAERYHVEFLELQDLMISAAGRAGYENITTDGIHLTEGGNEIIAGELMRFLADN